MANETKKILVTGGAGFIGSAVVRRGIHEGHTIKNIDKLKKDLFNFRFQKINSQVTNPSKIGETKKTIARLKTILKGKINA